jgi:hypothetical protein
LEEEKNELQEQIRILKLENEMFKGAKRAKLDA